MLNAPRMQLMPYHRVVAGVDVTNIQLPNIPQAAAGLACVTSYQQQPAGGHPVQVQTVSADEMGSYIWSRLHAMVSEQQSSGRWD